MCVCMCVCRVPGPWSNSISLAGVTAEQPPFPESLAIVPDSVGPRAFGLTWTMPASAYNLNETDIIVVYRLLISCIPGAACPANCPSGNCPSLDILPGDSACAGAAAPAGAAAGCTASIASDVLTANTNYSIRLVAQNTVLSPSSNAVAVTTSKGKPNAPTEPYSVSNYTTTSLVISFGAADPNGDPLKPYRVSLGCISGAVERTVTPPASAVEVSGLPQGANCSITVTASNSLGDSPTAAFPGFYYTQDRPRVGIAPQLSSQQLSGLPTTQVRRRVAGALNPQP